MDVPTPPVPRLFTATPPDMYPATPMSLPPATGHDWSHSGYGPPSPPAVAPELAAAMAETRTIRAKLADLCREFGPSAQSGWSARISLTVLNRYRDAAMLDRLSRTPSNNGEDALLRYRRERDEARQQLATQHEAMTQLRATHSEALAHADAQVEAALKTVSRWQDEHQRLIAENAAHTHIAEEVAELQQQLADVRGIAEDTGLSVTKRLNVILAYFIAPEDGGQ